MRTNHTIYRFFFISILIILITRHVLAKDVFISEPNLNFKDSLIKSNITKIAVEILMRSKQYKLMLINQNAINKELPVLNLDTKITLHKEIFNLTFKLTDIQTKKNINTAKIKAMRREEVLLKTRLLIYEVLYGKEYVRTNLNRIQQESAVNDAFSLDDDHNNSNSQNSKNHSSNQIILPTTLFEEDENMKSKDDKIVMKKKKKVTQEIMSDQEDASSKSQRRKLVNDAKKDKNRLINKIQSGSPEVFNLNDQEKNSLYNQDKNNSDSFKTINSSPYSLIKFTEYSNPGNKFKISCGYTNEQIKSHDYLTSTFNVTSFTANFDYTTNIPPFYQNNFKVYSTLIKSFSDVEIAEGQYRQSLRIPLRKIIGVSYAHWSSKLKSHFGVGTSIEEISFINQSELNQGLDLGSSSLVWINLRWNKNINYKSFTNNLDITLSQLFVNKTDYGKIGNSIQLNGNRIQANAKSVLFKNSGFVLEYELASLASTKRQNFNIDYMKIYTGIFYQL